jgi:hypothetical protein
VAPSDPSKWGASSSKGLKEWIGFADVEHVLVTGQGTIDGNGAPWWSAFSTSKVLLPFLFFMDIIITTIIIYVVRRISLHLYEVSD